MSVLTLSPDDRMRLARLQTAALSRLRERLGLTQEQMATRLGMSDGNYRNYERGAQPLTTPHIHSWAPVFGLSPAQFAHELGVLHDPREDAWWARLELELEGLPRDEIARHEAFLIDQPLEIQRPFLDVVRREWRKRRRQHERAHDDCNGAAS